MINLQNLIIQADYTWIDGNLHPNIKILINSKGEIEKMGVYPIEPDVRLPNQALFPGFVNSHSHSFQVGLRNFFIPTQPNQDFWSWRSEMYALSLILSPEKVQELAYHSFLSMKEAGITSVGEFHYLHHSSEGEKNYDLDKNILAAAKLAGIRIVLLLTYYERSGFEEAPLEPAQKRFVSEDLASFWLNFDNLSKIIDPFTQHLGVCAHSVRGVGLEKIKELKKEAEKRKIPFHIHLEEQEAEIEDCLKKTGKRPIDLLLDNLDVDENTTAIHCTFTEEEAMGKWLEKGGNICVCPLTEGHLGDGIFKWNKHPKTSEQITLGTDCNFHISFVEEMRWLLYLQQMRNSKRGLSPEIKERIEVSKTLFNSATRNGARALGLKCGEIKEGNYADFFSVDLLDPSIYGASNETILETFILGSNGKSILTNIVGGVISQYKPNAILLKMKKEVKTLKGLDTTDLVSFIGSMVDISSVTGQELHYSEALSKYLQSNEWVVTKQLVTEDRFNILATRRPFKQGDKGPRLILNSHTDVVPPHIPFTYDEKEGLLKGRGTCDAKTQIALQIYAANSYLKSHPEKASEIGLLYVVGEEVDHIGMKVANSLQLSPEFIICGEPTELKLAKLQKGILKAKIITTGVAAHSGYPEKGVSSIDALLDVLRDLKEFSWPQKEGFGQTTLNIGLLSSGAAANIIPAYSEAVLMFRLVTSGEGVLELLKEKVGGRAKIEVLSMNDPLELDELEDKTAFQTATVAFNTDLPYLKVENMKRFLFGAGSIMDAHGEREKVTRIDAEKGVEGYLKLIEELLGK